MWVPTSVFHAFARNVLSMAGPGIAVTTYCAALAAIPARGSDGQNQAVDIPTIIESIRAVESGIRNIEWRVSVREGELSANGDAWSLAKETAVRFDGTIRVDRNSSRYFATCSATQYINTPGQARSDDRMLESTFGSAYDGNVFRQWLQEGQTSRSGGTSLVYGDGIIDRDGARLNDAAFEKAHRSAAGLDWMPPGVFVDPTAALHNPSLAFFLQDRLRSEGSVTMTHSGSQYIFSTIANQRPGMYPLSTDITWDATAGAITGQVWYYDNPGGKKVLKEARIRLQKSGDYSVPGEVLFAEFNRRQPRAVRWAFDDVILNRPLADSDFLLTFPPDVQLTDYIDGKQYLTGSSVVDDQAAIRDFMTRTGAESPLGAATERMSATRLVAYSVLAGLACVLIVYAVRRWRQLPVILFALSLAGGMNGTAAAERGGSTIGHSPGEKIVVSRCGFRATIAALEYFSVKYNSQMVDEALVAFWDGIRLSDIVEVLDAYGLAVELRKDVTIAQVGSAISRRQLAIVPVRIENGWNHYYVAVVDKRGERWLLDPPHTAHRFENALRPDALAPTSGAVAFVNVEPLARSAAQIAVAPAAVDFGTFFVDGPKAAEAISRDLTLSNSGARPIVVSAVTSSCGCARTSWQGGLIPGGASKTVTLTLYPAAWGRGTQTKPIRMTCLNGTETFVEVRGNGITLAEGHGLSLSRSSITIPVDSTSDEPATSLVIHGNAESLERLDVRSTEPWLEIARTRLPDGAVALNLSYSGEKQPAGLRSLDARREAMLQLATTSAHPPLEVPIAVSEPSVLTIRPRHVRLSQSPSSPPAIVHILANSPACRPVEISDIQTRPHGLQVSVEELAPTEVGLRLAIVAGPEPHSSKLFVVSCRVLLSTGRTERLSLVVTHDLAESRAVTEAEPTGATSSPLQNRSPRSPH